MGIVWLILWWIISSDSPDKNRFIGQEEKEYILEATFESRSSAAGGEKNAPWKSFFTSKPLLALIFGHAASNWGTYLFLTSLPTYMKEVLQFDVKSVCLKRRIFDLIDLGYAPNRPKTLIQF